MTDLELFTAEPKLWTISWMTALTNSALNEATIVQKWVRLWTLPVMLCWVGGTKWGEYNLWAHSLYRHKAHGRMSGMMVNFSHCAVRWLGVRGQDAAQQSQPHSFSESLWKRGHSCHFYRCVLQKESCSCFLSLSLSLSCFSIFSSPPDALQTQGLSHNSR